MPFDNNPPDEKRKLRSPRDFEPRWQPRRDPELERALEELTEHTPEPRRNRVRESEPEPELGLHPEPEVQHISTAMPEARRETQLTADPAGGQTRAERRQCRRTKTPLRARVRPATIADSFEHVVTTLNASRDGLSFHAPAGFYRVGLPLHIAIPFQDARGALDIEMDAEVVRVVPLVNGGASVAVKYLRGLSLKQAIDKRRSL
jgi:PilZ domain-containing protein